MSSSGAPDADAYTKPFMLTASMRRDVYPAVDPSTNAELESSKKVVIVTGAGGGLGSAIAKSWAQAKAQGIIIVGRKIGSLEAVAKELGTSSKVIPVAADVTKLSDIEAVFKKAIAEFGHVDVLVNAHGAMNCAPVGTIDPASWWENFEVNVHGVYNTTHAFIQATNGTGTIVNLTSLAASFTNPAMSGYTASKLAVIKLGECLAVEHPNLRVVAVHPGMVEAEQGRGIVIDAFLPFSSDKQALTGGLTVYLATPRAAFLNGGYIHANWDVAELETHKEEIAEKSLIKLAFLNGKLQPGGYPWSS